MLFPDGRLYRGGGLLLAVSCVCTVFLCLSAKCAQAPQQGVGGLYVPISAAKCGFCPGPKLRLGDKADPSVKPLPGSLKCFRWG